MTTGNVIKMQPAGNGWEPACRDVLKKEIKATVSVQRKGIKATVSVQRKEIRDTVNALKKEIKATVTVVNGGHALGDAKH